MHNSLIITFSLLLPFLTNCTKPIKDKETKKPNVIIIFTDDQGYADVGCFGAEKFETPNLDKMANEGAKLTNFYVASSVCTPSRAALLTGCYPTRIGVTTVFFPEGPEKAKNKSNLGLNPQEETIAELLKAQNYATACIGKWHLGHKDPFMPWNQGFDYYFGLPYSNDMRPQNKPEYPPLPLMENKKVIAHVGGDQSQLTTQYTEKAKAFIKAQEDKPFFLYLAHSMPHLPLFVSDKFKGKTDRGLYGDVIEEIDWSVGEIMNTLKEEGIEDNTLVIFTSDNGPWLVRGYEHAGLAEPLRDGKMTVYEGGYRVPCIMKFPKQIPAGIANHEVVSSIDFLPTIANLTGAKLPEKEIDGKDFMPTITGKGNSTALHEYYYYFLWDQLFAVRHGKWKLIFPHNSLGTKKDENGKYIPDFGPVDWQLYDLENDISESKNLVDEYPDVVEKIKTQGESFFAEIKNDMRPCGVYQEN
ncbi:sulfatase family protein [Flexithrix dorotheae]|uniref:sulfatase family protein n=1 Tax=Flexithrix dorotheae TaxID=70993 RepID=UPI00037640D6|nr:sulfatase [Flexithrix dorotheae]